MTISTLQILVDKDLRQEAETFFTNAGLDISSAVRLFLRQVVIRQRITFEIVAENPDPFFSETNQLLESPHRQHQSSRHAAAYANALHAA